MVARSCRQTDPRYRVFPERRLPGPLKQTGVCEGLLGEVVSSTISSLPGRFFSSYFLSRLFSPVSSVPLFSHSFSRYLKDDIKSLAEHKCCHPWNLSWNKASEISHWMRWQTGVTFPGGESDEMQGGVVELMMSCVMSQCSGCMCLCWSRLVEFTTVSSGVKVIQPSWRWEETIQEWC